MVNQVIKIVCIHSHRAFQVNYTVIILKFINKFTHACQWANAPLQAMVQPMATRPQLKHDLHKQKPSVLEAQTFLSLLLKNPTKIYKPKFIHRTRGSTTSLHGRSLFNIVQKKTQVCNHIPKGEM